jgi:hypothetical protein
MSHNVQRPIIPSDQLPSLSALPLEAVRLYATFERIVAFWVVEVVTVAVFMSYSAEDFIEVLSGYGDTSSCRFRHQAYKAANSRIGIRG